MDAEEFKRRTKVFALRIKPQVKSLPKGTVTNVIGRQLLRSATSVGANYRAACRAKSRADFVAKLKIAEEECDESLYWFELLLETGQIKPALLHGLVSECNELLSLVVASIKTARSWR